MQPERYSTAGKANASSRPIGEGCGTHHPHRAVAWDRQDLAILLVILLVAVTVRQIYVWQLSHSPAFDQPQLDEQYHDQWTRAIVNGERFVNGPYFRAPLCPAFLAAIAYRTGDAAGGLRQMGLAGSPNIGRAKATGRSTFETTTGCALCFIGRSAPRALRSTWEAASRGC